MADNKDSFIAYCSWGEIFNGLSNEDAGQLAKHLFSYINDENPKSENAIVNVAFIGIRQTLKRDLKKYENYIKKQSENGLKGGRPKTQKTQPFSEKPKKADSVSVSDSVSENKYTPPASEFNFSFVEPKFRLPFLDWYNYKVLIKKPFKLQVAVESAYKEMKEMANNNPLEATKIVQYSIAREYKSLCMPDKKQTPIPTKLQGTI